MQVQQIKEDILVLKQIPRKFPDDFGRSLRKAMGRKLPFIPHLSLNRARDVAPRIPVVALF
jgi:hypothetical protein